MMRFLPLAILVFPGCRDEIKDTGPADTAPGVDADGDGFDNDVDCNDSDASIYPGAAEACDGLDNNCSGEVDEGLLTTWYPDEDGDLFGDGLGAIEACVAPAGHVSDGRDCNDLDAEVNPDADESCDLVDNDCDDLVDEPDASDAGTWYRDADLDGWGVDTETLVSCDLPAGYAPGSGDCDDSDPAFHPGASESDCTDSADYNCDGSVGHADADADGFAACEDCDDSDAAVNEDAVEVCDSVDNDCNGLADSDDPGVTGTNTYYGDADGDGYGGQQFQESACEASPGFVTNSDDCDDVDASSYPGASEVCDDADNDCDGDIDEGVGSTWYQDSDSDGYGNGSVSATSCDAPSGYVGNALDCDDFTASTNPASFEVCDGQDNDCDGSVDEDAINASTFYVDSDGDGYGNAASSTTACEAATGYADNDSDCNDADSAVNPVATEVCDTVDNDCDGSTDEADASDASTWYQDLDSDGYGNAANQASSCSQPTGYVADATDCDDTNGSTNTAGTELCDFVDNDCDGTVDEDDAADAQTWYQDSDADGYGTANATAVSCTLPAGYAVLNTDCDDTDANANPGITEVCDGIDNNCDGTADENLLGTAAACAAGSCLALYEDDNSRTDGNYYIDPSGSSPMEVTCNMSNGGETLCAALTKGYVPSYMLYNEDAYAFQARLNSDDDYVFDTDAPSNSASSWDASETLNYGQFCRVMGTGVTQTRLQSKLYNGIDNGSSMRGVSYAGTYEGTFSGNLFLQWFTNSSASRTFSLISGSQLHVQDNNNGYGGVYTTPNVGWSSTSNQSTPYTHSTNPWNGVCSAGPGCCVGCTNSGGYYESLPYGQTTILNDTSHSFWAGIPSLPYGWSDCTNNGNCNYHESGYGVWLFWVK